MYHNQGFQGDHKGSCGSWGRHKGNWGKGKMRGIWRQMGRFAQPPVNIEETDAQYTISLYAAGLVKNKVTLTVKNDVLVVAYPGAEETAEPNTSGYTYQEYTQGAFERHFQLNNKVLVEGISASYADGILKVTLPKNPETNKPTQTITVA